MTATTQKLNLREKDVQVLSGVSITNTADSFVTRAIGMDVIRFTDRINNLVGEGNAVIAGGLAVRIASGDLKRTVSDVDYIVSRATFKKILENAKELGLEQEKKEGKSELDKERTQFKSRDGMHIDFMFGDVIPGIPNEAYLHDVSKHTFVDPQDSKEKVVYVIKPPLLALMKYKTWLERWNKNNHRDGRDAINIINNGSTIDEFLEDPAVKRYQTVPIFETAKLRKGLHLIEKAVDASDTFTKLREQHSSTKKEIAEITSEMQHLKAMLSEAIRKNMSSSMNEAMNEVKSKIRTVQFKCTIDKMNKKESNNRSNFVQWEVRAFVDTVRDPTGSQ